MDRTCLKTIRLTPEENRRVSGYLRRNPLFDGFGSLARIATLEFIRARQALPLRPLPEAPAGAGRPSFLWDYDLSETQVREILEKGGKDRDWLMARILERAPFGEVFRFLTPGQIREALPRLRLSPKRKAHWAYALARWSKGAGAGDG